MSSKCAYIWGPISSFSGPLAAFLIGKGWHVHVAVKSSLNLFSLSPLDLHSTALSLLEQALGGKEQFRTFQDRIKLIDESEPLNNKSSAYDSVIFCGLPPNWDEARAPRAPWAASRLPAISKALKGVPIFIISSLWAALQPDRVVPEEFEFERRKSPNTWETQCQQYELKLLDGLTNLEAPWYLVRLPIISPSTKDGELSNFSGLNSFFREMQTAAEYRKRENLFSRKLKVAYNPDSTLWFMPVDFAVNVFWRYMEDPNRPRICNFVCTQATLNREWMHHLGQALGEGDIAASDNDTLNLSGVLRRLLMEDVQVKTRNLFEVAGRYQLSAPKLNKEYFESVLERGKQLNWGAPESKQPAPQKTLTGFSEQLAQYYFEEFIPSKFSESLLKKATTGGVSIGFLLKGANGLGWVIKSPNGATVVERLEPSSERPRVCFHFSGKTMNDLIQSKLPLTRALLLREVQVEGPLLQAMRVVNVIEQFLKQNPMDQNDLKNFGAV